MKIILKILGGLSSFAGYLCGTLSSITFGAWLLKLCVPALFDGTAFATYPLGMLTLKLTLAGIGLGILSIALVSLRAVLIDLGKEPKTADNSGFSMQRRELYDKPLRAINAQQNNTEETVQAEFVHPRTRRISIPNAAASAKQRLHGCT